MKVTYTKNRFEIDGVQIINPEVITAKWTYYRWLELSDNDTWDLPDNIIAEKEDKLERCFTVGLPPTRLVEVYRLKLKERLVDTGSKESQDIIIDDLMNEFAPDWYKNYDDCPNIYEEIKSKFIITRK